MLKELIILQLYFLLEIHIVLYSVVLSIKSMLLVLDLYLKIIEHSQVELMQNLFVLLAEMN